MKNLSNILRRSSITPYERVKTLVHNDLHREKTGEDMLSSSELYVLTGGWAPTATEAKEYNRYINIVRLEGSMRMDAYMFMLRSERNLLRNCRVLDNFFLATQKLKDMGRQEFLKDIPKEESMKFLTRNTYLEYKKVLQIFTFKNLSKEVQDDLLLLDDGVLYSEYLDDQVFLYEHFKDGVSSKQGKGLIIARLYAHLYHDGIRKMKNGTEKDGFRTHTFFADMPVKTIIQKWADDAHIPYDEENDIELLSSLGEYAKSKNTTMELVIKDTISKWLDEGLFTTNYSPLFMSERFDTWNGNTKKNHKELFMIWYDELQKSKEYFQKLFNTGKLKKESVEQNFLWTAKTVEVLTGESLYTCNEDIVFVKEYKKQADSLLQLSNLFLFVSKYAHPVQSYKTLSGFRDIAQRVSDLFDIDITPHYTECIESYEDEVKLMNGVLSRIVDKTTEELYDEKLEYVIDIFYEGFSFNLKTNAEFDGIVEKYAEEFKKSGL